MKKVLLIVLIFPLLIGAGCQKDTGTDIDLEVVQKKAISYAKKEYGENIKFETVIKKRAIKMYEDNEPRYLFLLFQNDNKKEVLYVDYDREGSSNKKLSDEQFDRLYKIDKIIKESSTLASQDGSISDMIFRNPDDFQYTYEPLGNIYEYTFSYDGPDGGGIGSFPMSYAVYVDDKGSIFFSQITELLFVD
ncbi:hypothetical protein HOB10_00050 [Candidatus Parcubacteria bacterium]|jgi:hypothetical protein|nr:hypothetical protein [Candidatus Parcubacteria bacterium]